MTTTQPAFSRIVGTLRSVGEKGVVRMDTRFDVGVEELWSAVTDPRRLDCWLGEIVGDLTLGGEFQAYFFASGWRGTGRVEKCEAPRRLLVATKHTNAADEQAIELTLTADGERATIFAWEERGMPVDLLAPYGAGVQVHVEDLAAYLAGDGRCDAEARFDELLPTYQKMASNVG